MRASPKPRLENYESVQHRLQFSGRKKGVKISFHRHFNKLTKGTLRKDTRLGACFLPIKQ